MPRACTICGHPERAAIEGALAEGQPIRTVATRFDVSRTVLHRHQVAGHDVAGQETDDVAGQNLVAGQENVAGQRSGTNPALRAALTYASLGWAVIPLHWLTEIHGSDGQLLCCCGRSSCVPRGKHPLTKHGRNDASKDPDQIRAWWAAWPRANVGIATGEESGLAVLDIDPHKGGNESLFELILDHGPIPDTLEAITGGRGRHILFRYPAERMFPSTSGNLGIGLDTRGFGGYIVAAPSNHKSGGSYDWDGLDVTELPALLEASPLAEVPAWMLERLAPTRSADAPADPPAAVEPIDQETFRNWALNYGLKRVKSGKGRNDTGLYIALQCRDQRVPYAEALAILAEYTGLVAGLPPHEYKLEEAEHSLRQAYGRAPREPWALEPVAVPTISGTVRVPTTTPEDEVRRLISLRRPVAEVLALCARVKSSMVRDELTARIAHEYGASRTAVREDMKDAKRTVHGGPRRLSDEEAASASEWRGELLSKPDTGKLDGIVHNAIVILTHDERWAGRVAWNDFSQTLEFLQPPPYELEATEAPAGGVRVIRDDDSTRAAAWLQRHWGLYVGQEIVTAALLAVARRASFHPVKDYLSGLTWDGIDRLEHWLIDNADSEDSAYTRAVSKAWLISAVARVMAPGCKADHVLILEGEQGARKSSAIRTLAEPWFADELDTMGSKDAAQQLQGTWIVELAELDALSRTELSRVKAFVTRSVDRFRPSYGRFVQSYARQCVFAGTVNHSDYLRDETGGRRFWPVRVGQIDTDGLALRRDQLWAEAMHRFRAGEPWYLTDADTVAAAKEQQEERYQADAWEVPIAALLEEKSAEFKNWPSMVAHERCYTTISEVLSTALKLEIGKHTQPDQNRVARCLKRLGWERRQVRIGNLREWRYQPSEKTSRDVSPADSVTKVTGTHESEA